MNKEDLNVTKPHFINRFEKQSILKLAKPNKPCKDTQLKVRDKVEIQKSTNKQYWQQNRTKEVKKMKLELLLMIKECREEEEINLQLRKGEIVKRNKEHKQIIEEISQKLALIKKQIYQLYRHSCGNEEDKLCSLCKQRQKVYKEQILKYLVEDQTFSGQNTVLKDKINQFKPTNNNIKRNTSSNSVAKDFQNKINLQDSKIIEEQPLNFLSRQNESRKSQRLSTFRINKKTEKIESVQKKIFQVQSERGIRDIDSIFVNKETQRKYKKKNTAYPLENNFQTSTLQKNQNDQENQCNLNNSSKLPNEQKLERRQSKRSFRKSIKKLTNDLQPAEPQSHNGHKSKFYDLSVEQKLKKTQSNQIASNSRNSKYVGTKEQEIEQYKLSREKPKQKMCSYQRVKNLKKSQIFMDLTEIQSSKNIEQEIVHRQRHEIQQLIRQREKSVDNAQSKLSRYQRERLIYGYLKKQLVKMRCVDEYNETSGYLYCSNNESQASLENQERLDNYSMKDRKQSLFSKLNIFNQSVNFQDMKTKIETVISEKQALGQNLISDTQMLINHSKGRKEQKIVQKFLAQVLKINDLKRLLRKKFSKELDWSPKMREMHQFYTYLEFNLQNFRMNLIRNTENNLRKLSLQGKGEEFCLDQLKITEDIGNYQGLENTEITQFQHHKEIECSMRYYGIEVKRLEQLQNFFYPPPEIPQPVHENVKQRSLKQIQQCDLSEILDLKGESLRV